MTIGMLALSKVIVQLWHVIGDNRARAREAVDIVKARLPTTQQVPFIVEQMQASAFVSWDCVQEHWRAGNGS